MWVGVRQVISQIKPSKSASRRVLELRSDPPREGTGENFVTERSRRASGKAARESLRGRGGIGSGLNVGSSSRPWGPESLRAGPGPLGSAVYLGLPAALGRSLGRVSGRPAPGARGSMAPDRGTPLVLLAAPTRLRAPGQARVPGKGGSRSRR